MEELPGFLATDQYGVGMLPRDHVRNLLLVHSPWGDESIDFRYDEARTSLAMLSDSDFENEYEDWTLRMHKRWDAADDPSEKCRVDSRHQLEPVLRMPQLRVLEMDAVMPQAE